MLFGKPSKHFKSTKPKPKSNINEDSKNDNPSTDAVNDSVIGNSKDDSTNKIMPNKPKGHGRMPHTVYTNATEHLPAQSFKRTNSFSEINWFYGQQQPMLGSNLQHD